jgi:hypothetical protein
MATIAAKTMPAAAHLTSAANRDALAGTFVDPAALVLAAVTISSGIVQAGPREAAFNDSNDGSRDGVRVSVGRAAAEGAGEASRGGNGGGIGASGGLSGGVGFAADCTPATLWPVSDRATPAAGSGGGAATALSLAEPLVTAGISTSP